jgi:hypothetical protein
MARVALTALLAPRAGVPSRLARALSAARGAHRRRAAQLPILLGTGRR